MVALLGEAREEVLCHASALLRRAREMVREPQLIGLTHVSVESARRICQVGLEHPFGPDH